MKELEEIPAGHVEAAIPEAVKIGTLIFVHGNTERAADLVLFWIARALAAESESRTWIMAWELEQLEKEKLEAMRRMPHFRKVLLVGLWWLREAFRPKCLEERLLAKLARTTPTQSVTPSEFDEEDREDLKRWLDQVRREFIPSPSKDGSTF